MQYDLYHELAKKQKKVILIDSKELLMNPKNILIKLCKEIKIPFNESMLSWQKGPKKEDGVWAKYWYKKTHQSSGFKSYNQKKIILKGSNIELAKNAAKYYNFLYSKALKN